MNIPTQFTTAIATAFYDKVVSWYNSSVVTDDEGYSRIRLGSLRKTYNANIHYENLEKVQEEYGLEDDIDIVITTSENVDINSIQGYQGRLYKIIKALPYDSHYFLIGQEWTEKSEI